MMLEPHDEMLSCQEDEWMQHSTIAVPLDGTQPQQIRKPTSTTQIPYSTSKCVHELFEDQAQQTPKAIAIAFEDKQMTYEELNQSSNRLAHYLRAQGVGPEVRVGVYVERSLDMVIGLLGILKAGGGYVPLDPTSPKERVALTLAEAQASVLLTQNHVLAGQSIDGIKVVCLDSDKARIVQASAESISSGVVAENLAYLIYTSGSTGIPKGVQIEHRALLNLIFWHQMTFAVSQTDRATQIAGPAFDASVWELWPYLTIGASVYMPNEEVRISPFRLKDWIVSKAITISFVPTPLAESMLLLDWPRDIPLRVLLTGGDRLNHYPPLHLPFQLVNNYGPTENTVVTTSALILPEKQATPSIGHPINNTQVYLLDQDLHPVPLGVSGELHISSLSLARGYFNDSALTAEKFIPNPFSSTPGARIYKTGDWARYRTDGTIEFVGRIDSQVKLRGFRIELGEIESVLHSHPAIQGAVVLVREVTPDEKYLVAYVVLKSKNSTSKSDLHYFLQKKLPIYMIPKVIIILDKFPLTPNGKIDRYVLPIPNQIDPERKEAFVAPRTSIEESLTTIWTQVLGLKRISVLDNFFELGGHSIAATQIVARIRQTFNVDVLIRAFFEKPTIAGLAEIIEADRDSSQSLQIPPIRQIPRDSHLPLSFPQEQVWFLQQLDPTITSYHFQATFLFTGNLKITALEQSLSEMIRRHEIFRTTFDTIEEKPIQIIHPPQHVHLKIKDINNLSVHKRDLETQQVIAEELSKPFDMTKLPLIRWTLLRLQPQEYILIHVEHHLVHDGWSFNVFVHEFVELYKAFSAGKPSPLPELPIQFADFAYWQRQWIQGKVLETQLTYWKRKLAGSPPILRLPTDHPRPAVQSFRGAAPRIQFPATLYKSLKALSHQEGVTLFMTMLAAFLVLLYKYTEQEDMCIGSGIANRRLRETEGLIGMIVNPVVLRTDLSGNPTFQKLLQRVREVTLEAYAHQDTPFDKVVEALQPERNRSYNPLFQVMFGFHDAPLPTYELPGLTLSFLEGLSNQSAKFDLNVIVLPRSEQHLGRERQTEPEEITVLWEYNTDLFEDLTIQRMVEHYRTVLESVVINPTQHLADLSILTEAEQQMLLIDSGPTIEEYLGDWCIHGLFENQVEQIPDTVALVYEDKSLTYRELNQRSNRLAHLLRALGIGPEVKVGICAERSPELIIGLLSILKSGGAYVPLDPANPKERLAFICKDACIPVLLTQKHLLANLPKYEGEVICLDTEHPVLPKEYGKNLFNRAKPDNLAYIIYTSGSSGKPKGVMIPHKGICNRLLWMQKFLHISRSDRILQKTSLAFDVAVNEIFLPLICGAGLILAKPEGHRDSSYLAHLIAAQQVTFVHFVPSMLRIFLEDTHNKEYCSSLKYVWCGGEILSVDLQERFFHYFAARLYNGYGPTEASVGVTAWMCMQNSDLKVVPIGRPIANTRIYLLDKHFRVVPVGVPGELYIGGAALARGYLQRPDLTAEQFIPHPFSTVPGARLYRTGDLARYLADGNIEYIGRIDQQVKVRGFRIELGEIEAVLRLHYAVRDAVVIVHENIDNNRIIACVVPERNQALNINEIREWIKEHLPRYMIPSNFLLLDTLPLTPSGKVDRQALPIPTHVSTELNETYLAPRTSLEEVLVSLWKQALGLQQIGIQDDFFDLGGHSLLATRIIAQIRKLFRLEIPLRILFEEPTVAGVAKVLTQSEAKPGQAERTAQVLQKIWDLSAEDVKDALLKENKKRGIR